MALMLFLQSRFASGADSDVFVPDGWQPFFQPLIQQAFQTNWDPNGGHGFEST